MRLLLDTHIALWFVTGDQTIPPKAKRAIEDPEYTAFTSVVSIWEVAIKSALRRGGAGEMKLDGHEAARDFVAAGFEILPVTAAHAAAVGDLPHHHNDPFDRLLVAKAKVEGLRLVTHDATLAAYGDHILVV